MDDTIALIFAAIVPVLFLTLLYRVNFLGYIRIEAREVGIVIKKFSGRVLPRGRLIACLGEAGYQAQTLAPGQYFGYWPWQFTIHKVHRTAIAADEIGLVVANDGAELPASRRYGRIIECDNFQDGCQFMTQGGEKGCQEGYLRPGTYRINLALFTIITTRNAAQFKIDPALLRSGRSAVEIWEAVRQSQEEKCQEDSEP